LAQGWFGHSGGKYPTQEKRLLADQQYSLNIFWGKLKADPGNATPIYLPLTHHCLDVAAVFRHLVDLPAFQRCLVTMDNTSLTPVQLDRLAVLALLHDFGKANLGFQDKPFDTRAPRAGHIYEAAPLLNEEHLANQLAQSLEQSGGVIYCTQTHSPHTCASPEKLYSIF
jgi:hypothetical protein